MPNASTDVIRTRMTEHQATRHHAGTRVAVRAPHDGVALLGRSAIPGTRRRIDVVFPTERVAIYIDGCFWHACPEHGTIPKQNRQWWVGKLAANRARDIATDTALRADGWTVLRFWEHDEPQLAARKVRAAVVGARRTATKRAAARNPRASIRDTPHESCH